MRQGRRISGRIGADTLSGCEQQVSTHKPIYPREFSPHHVGVSGVVAAAIIGLQALGCAVFAVIFLFAAPKGASLSDTSHLMFSVFTVLFAIGLGLVARGLWRGKGWARTATVVWLVMLLPLVWTMVQAGRGLVGVLILSGAVIGIGAVAGMGAVAAEDKDAARP